MLTPLNHLHMKKQTDRRDCALEPRSERVDAVKAICAKSDYLFHGALFTGRRATPYEQIGNIEEVE